MKTVTLSNRFYYRELDEQHKKAVQQKQNQLKRIEAKISEKQKKIKKIDQKISKLIEKTKQGKQTEKDYLKEVQEQ